MNTVAMTDEEFYEYAMAQEKEHGTGYSPLYHEAQAWAKKNAIFNQGDFIAIPRRRGHDTFKLLGIGAVRNKKRRRIEVGYSGVRVNPKTMKPLRKKPEDERLCPCCVAKATLVHRPPTTA